MKFIFLILGGFLTIIASAQVKDSTAVVKTYGIKQADSLIRNYQFKKALDVLAKCDTANVGVLLRIGLCNFRLGGSQSAIRPYQQVLKIDSSNSNALNQLAQLYARDGDFSNAFDSYLRLVALDSTNSYYYKQAGSMAVRMDNEIIARVWYGKALRLNPNDMEASLALGTILLNLEEFSDADTLVENALVVDPIFRPILLLKAKLAFERRNYARVITTVNTILEKADTAVIYARLLGASYFQLHDYSKVKKCMTFLLNNNVNHDWIYYYLGVASRESGDIQASVDYLKMAVKQSISENTGTYFSELGQSYEQMKDYQNAIRAYHSAYNNSGEGLLLYRMAVNCDIYYKDKTTALIYYKRYLRSGDTIARAKAYSRNRISELEK